MPLPESRRQERHQPLSRVDYADRFGPTVGDRIRLADTDLRIEIKADWCGGPAQRQRDHLRRRQGHPGVDGPVMRARDSAPSARSRRTPSSPAR